MNIKPIIVREYLESLTESEELDYIFPILLESQGFIIHGKPKDSKGFAQFGKDIVATGNDFDGGVHKRFFFELKGGKDRHITDTTYSKKDGIRESIIEAKDRKFEFANNKYTNLPLKIVLVHNGEIKPNVKETFDGFIEREFPKDGKIEFDRWGISELTKLFSEKLFGAFLLTDSSTTKLFNKVLINLDVSERVSENFIELLNSILSKVEHDNFNSKISRKVKMLFESLRLISFVIYTESKSYNNISIAKKYISFLIVRFWYWILKNKLELNKNVTTYFDKILNFYLYVLTNYFDRTLPIAQLKDGLFSEKGGRYEQIGYTVRTFEYLQDLCFYLNIVTAESKSENSDKNKVKQLVINILNSNNVSNRPLLDIHSIPIINTLIFFLKFDDLKNAKLYLIQVLDNLINAKRKYDRFPDANNDIRNIIKYETTHEKSIYYSDSTSLLLASLLEFVVILDMEDAYYIVRDFINEFNIDIAIFIPHHGISSTSKYLIEDLENDLEEQLFSKTFFSDGYQHNWLLKKNFNEDMSYEDFKDFILSNKNEFLYEYRTDKAGYSFLKDLAHIYYRTPLFPDKWRKYLKF